MKITQKQRSESPRSAAPTNILELPTCTRCGLCQGRTQVVANQIVPDCKLLFVAQAPGWEEDRVGSPLVGRSGRLWQGVLACCGVHRNDVSICNVVQCFPPNDRKPERDEIAACRPWLEYSITQARPKVIVTLGDVALYALTGRTGVTAHVGRIMYSPRYPGIPIIPCVHPAYVLRSGMSPEVQGTFASAMLRAVQLSEGRLEQATSSVVVVNNDQERMRFLDTLESADRFVIDTETSSLRISEGYVVCMSFSTTPGSSWVLPWRPTPSVVLFRILKDREGKKRFPPISDVRAYARSLGLPEPVLDGVDSTFISRLSKIFMDPSKIKLLHNCSFDLKFLRKEGLDIAPPIIDTMLGHYLVNEKPPHDLGALARRMTTLGDYDSDLQRASGHKADSYAVIRPDVLYEYAGKDADATFQIGISVSNTLASQGRLGLLTAFLVPMAELSSRMESRGVCVDLAKRDEIRGQIDSRIAGLISEWNSLAPGVDPNSPKQVSDFIYGTMKEPSEEATKTQLGSTEASALTRLSVSAGSPTVRAVSICLSGMRKLGKLRSSYIDNLSRYVESDGRVRASILVHGTETGRLSYQDPPLQTIPRPRKKGDLNIRSLFVATPGYAIVSSDYSQAELRMLGHLTQDPELLRIFSSSSLSIHWEVVRTMLDPNYELLPKEEQDSLKTIAKAVNFGVLYGQGAPALSEGCTSDLRDLMGGSARAITIVEAQRFLDQWYMKFGSVRPWKERELAKVRQQGYAESIFGRRRHFPAILSDNVVEMSESERAAINHLVQGPASDLTLMAAIRIDKYFRRKFDFHTLVLVHDAIIWEVRRGQERAFCDAARAVMVDAPRMSLPFDAEFKAGPSWGELEGLEKWEPTTAPVVNRDGL